MTKCFAVIEQHLNYWGMNYQQELIAAIDTYNVTSSGIDASNVSRIMSLATERTAMPGHRIDND